jgi:hypothetical protein
MMSPRQFNLHHLLINRDQYSSVKYIELINLQEEEREIESKEIKTLAEKKRLNTIKQELIPLKIFIDNAAFHREQIKNEIG